MGQVSSIYVSIKVIVISVPKKYISINVFLNNFVGTRWRDCFIYQYLFNLPMVFAPQMSTEDESRVSLSDRLKIGEEQVKQLEKENSRVTDQLREVIGMNTRWQRYNEQRETYVVKLTKTNQQQQSKITVLEQQVRGLEQNINDLNTLLQKMDAGKKKNTDAYVMSLEQQLVQKEDEVIELKEQVATLKVTLHTTEKQRGVAQRLEDKEMIETLKEQVHK